MELVAAEHPIAIREVSEQLAKSSIHKVEEIALHGLFEKDMITPKIHIELQNELRSGADID